MLLFAACIIALISLQWVRREIGRCYSKLPPGYSPWSFLSDTRGLLRPCSPTALGQFMDQRMQSYGKIFTINFLGSPAVVSADAELNQLVLVNEMRLFGDAWTGAFRDVLGETSIPLQVGDVHKKLKSIILGFIASGRAEHSSSQRNVGMIAARIFGSWRDGSVVPAVDAARKVTKLRTQRK